jgi:TonB family protein
MSHPRAFVRRSRFRRSLVVAAALVLLCVFPEASPLAQTGGTGKPATSSKTRRRPARRRPRRRPVARRANTSATPVVTIVGTPDVEPRPDPQPPPATPGASFGERPRVVSGGILNGKAISKPAPPYPAIARAARAQGTVTVQILVDEEGKVVSASAVSGHPLLQQAAVNAARGARFAPTLLSGRPVRVSGVITYNFVLQ